AKIAFMGARAGGYRLGSRVLVVGAGPIGQMSVRWASAAGARAVIAADTERRRLALATAGGATAGGPLPAGDCRAEIERLTSGALADVVVAAAGPRRCAQHGQHLGWPVHDQGGRALDSDDSHVVDVAQGKHSARAHRSNGHRPHLGPPAIHVRE